MTNEKAREYFKEKGLDYSMIKRKDIEKLKQILKDELAIFKNPSRDDLIMSVKMIRKNDMRLSSKGIFTAFLRVKATLDDTGKRRYTYFRDREAISFNRDGFIGFGGWADSENVKPFLSAFIKWCDLVSP